MAKRTSTKSVKVAKKIAAKVTKARKTAAKPVLLSGGNPQIAKGYGDAAVQAYIEAMPGGRARSGAASTR